MSLFRKKYRIESARMAGWDYSRPGYYFVTVCTYGTKSLFGEIVNGEMLMNGKGSIVRDEWLRSFEIRRELARDEFVVMPNHFHGIVRIVADRGIIVETPWHDVSTGEWKNTGTTIQTNRKQNPHKQEQWENRTI